MGNKKVEIIMDYDTICPRCNKPGAIQNGVCLQCNLDILKGGPIVKPKRQPATETTRTQIKKVKVKDRIKIEWNVYKGKSEEPDEYALNCADEPREAFREAMAALAVHVAAICELPEKDAETIRVSGVSFSYSEEGIMGAAITGLKSLRNSSAPLVLNTPHKPEAPYGEGGDESNVLPEETVTALYELIAEAEAYIRGERKYKQMDLFEVKEEAVTA